MTASQKGQARLGNEPFPQCFITKMFKHTTEWKEFDSEHLHAYDLDPAINTSPDLLYQVSVHPSISFIFLKNTLWSSHSLMLGTESWENQRPCLRGKTDHDKYIKLVCDYCVIFLGATPMAQGGSQARGLTGAAAAILQHSHSNAGSVPHLRPNAGSTPQLMAVPDALTP